MNTKYDKNLEQKKEQLEQQKLKIQEEIDELDEKLKLREQREDLEHLNEITDKLNEWIQDPVLEKYAGESVISKLWAIMDTIDKEAMSLEAHTRNVLINS